MNVTIDPFLNNFGPNVTNTYRYTKIIVTLGPTTQAKTTLAALIEAGVDVMRLNMAHASHDWVAEVIWHIREVSTQLGRDVAIMMDVKGPEIRTGKLDAPIQLRVGERIEFHTAAAISMHATLPSIPVNYLGLPADVTVGSEMLVDSGLIRLRIIDKDDTHILAEVLTSGVLGSRRHINLPGVHVKLPALTEKDEHDLRAGVAAGIDFVALSFVREAEDVVTLRRFLDGLGSKPRSSQKSKTKRECGIVSRSFERRTQLWSRVAISESKSSITNFRLCSVISSKNVNCKASRSSLLHSYLSR